MFSTAAERRVSWHDGELEAPRPCTGPKLHGGTGGLVFVQYCGWTVGSSNEAAFLLSMGFSGAIPDALEKPISFGCDAAKISGRFVGIGRSNFAQGSEERFDLLLRANCDSKVIAHGRKAAADKNIARGKLIDDGPHVGLHVDHHEIRLRRNEESSVF